MTRKGVPSLLAVFWVWLGSVGPLQSVGGTLWSHLCHSLLTSDKSRSEGAGSLSHWRGALSRGSAQGRGGPAQDSTFSSCLSRFQRETRRGRKGRRRFPASCFICIR